MVARVRYAVAVGSNRGERSALVAQARTLVCADGMVEVQACAAVLETAAIGPGVQGPYLNSAWILASDLGPHQLLHRLQAIEAHLGRTRCQAWGPRTIDLDLLLRDDGLVVDSGVLTLPHPRMHLRRFVLEPLAQVAGSWRHPRLGRTITDLLAALPARAG